MTRHVKFEEILLLLRNNINVLIHGSAGSGKTTVISQVAEELEIPFYALSMTRQTTLSHIIGFMNVNGIYVPSLFRKAVEEGGLFLLDELDAADPNVVLSLNTLENGFVSFPDKIVEVHKDFRLAATANPFDAHSRYTGRSTLDAATLDRFDKVALDLDDRLEASLVSQETFGEISQIRKIIELGNVNIEISMRDTIRWDKRKSLGLTDGYIENVLLDGSYGLYEKFLTLKPKVRGKQEDMKDIDSLWELLLENAND